MWAGFLAYLGVLALAPALGRRVLWGAIWIAVLGFALAPPLLSHDVYSYVDYARLGALHGIDPYLRGPAAAPTDPAFAKVTWPHTPSAYGPLFTLATYPLALVGVGTAVWALKALAAASVLAIAAIVARLAPARGVDPLRAAAMVALNPLVLVQVIGGAHNDALAMLAVMVGVAGCLSARESAGGAALVAAIGVKLSTALAAPFALLGSARRGRLLLGVLLAAAAIIAAAHLAFGWNWLEGLSIAGENAGRFSHLSVPSTLARITGSGRGASRAIALALYATGFAYLLLWTWRGGDWLRAAAWAFFGLLLATSWLLPWYLIWALPLTALSRDRRLWAAVLLFSAFQLGARI